MSHNPTGLHGLLQGQIYLGMEDLRYSFISVPIDWFYTRESDGTRIIMFIWEPG
jgi:hypothetical protein